MLAQSYTPAAIHSQELDLYLAHGWFRQGQNIFTTNFLKSKGLTYSAIWLRIDLRAFSPTKTHQKLQKLNAKFRVEIRPFILTETHESLFSQYKSGVSFEAALSLQELLLSEANYNVFDTYELSLYDQDKLIATGIFDVGESSLMGITCFYNPHYQKFSLGKYLMFLKMDFAKNRGMDYFYPGYFSPNNPVFDYKLELAKPFTEYFELKSNSWKSIREYSISNVPFEVMSLKLRVLQNLLAQKNIETTLFNYEFFDAELFERFSGLDTFDFPIFLQCFKDYGNIKQNPIIAYDVRDAKFHLIICEGIYDITFLPNNPHHFTAQILRITQHLFSTEPVEIMANVVATSFALAEENSVTNPSKIQL